MTNKKAEEFFYKHAARSWPVGASDAEKDRLHRELARRLAEAEQWARDNGYWFSWEEDPDAGFEEAYQVTMIDDEHGGSGCLGGVIEGYDETANRVARRLYEADLAREEMERVLGTSNDDVSEDLAFINDMRRQIGMKPLEPETAGWTSDDVRREAQRVRGNPTLRGQLLSW